MARFLIALIAFTIAFQNTCPYGYAGKTAIAAPCVHNCPLKDHQPVVPHGKKTVEKDLKNYNHPFVLVSMPIDTFKTFAPVKETGIINPTEHKDVFMIPPHRPPKNRSFLPEAYN